MDCKWKNYHGECDLHSKQDKKDPVLERLNCDDYGNCLGMCEEQCQ